MSLVGFLLIIVGLAIGRAAYRSVIFAAQLGKPSEEGGEERADGDCFPAPLIPFNSERI